MPDIPTPWVGLAALLAMFVLPFVPDWLFEGPRTVRHRPRRHVCGDCNAPWTEGHICSPEASEAEPTSAGRTSPACAAGRARTPPRGTDLALGPPRPYPGGGSGGRRPNSCATTGEREAPRWSGLARARRPCVAAPTCQCELRHSSLVHY